MIPQLGQESERLLHTRDLGFVTVEKLQQIGIFQGFYRVHPHSEGVELLRRKNKQQKRNRNHQITSKTDSM